MSRLHVAAGDHGVTVDVIVAWPTGADPHDVEVAIKDAARAAVLRYRDDAGVRR